MLSTTNFCLIVLLAIGIEAKLSWQPFEPHLTAPFKGSLESVVRKRRNAEDTSSSESIELNGEMGEMLTKFLVAAAWEGDKTKMLTSFLEEMSDYDNNVTAIGWQHILDDQGKVTEIRSIQLVIPPKPNDDNMNIVEDDDDDDFDTEDRLLPHKAINKMRSYFEPLEQMGTPGSITMERYGEDGSKAGLLYLDKDELYFNGEGFAVYNKTKCATKEEVNSFITNLKPGCMGKPTVLKYDVDCHLIPDQSHIKPQLLGSVIDNHEATEKMLREAPEMIAQIAYKYPKNEIPKQLAAEYCKTYPEYKWRVLVDPSEYYVKRDVSLTLSYDNFDLDECSDISYLMIGIKK